jgi:PAS domain-containing protein
VQPVRGRTAGRGRPALVAGVFLLVASLVLLAPPPVTPDLSSLSFPSSLPLVDVLVQGGGAAGAVAAVGGTSLAAACWGLRGHLLFAQGAGRPFGAIHGPDGFRFGPADPGRPPEGWREVLVAQGRHLGVIVLGNLDRPDAPPGPGMRLGRQDLQLLSPLTSGLAVTLGNATQVAQIEEEKSTLEPILGLSSDGILLLDGKGRVRVWNQAMERITRGPGRRGGRPAPQRVAGRSRPRRQAGPAGGAVGRGHPGSARGPPPRCRSAPPRAGGAGCAATTRCCTRAASGPPMW